jgi:hypothetical protein
MPRLTPPPPIECVMLCGHLPEVADENDLPRWALKAAQRYEICAARHNACAGKLIEKEK